jgi:three-Cys-motif partner protein
MDNFFEESTEQSRLKAEIVANYFVPWAKIVLSGAKKRRHDASIMYMDLFAGPGRYKDGSMSTPLMVLQRAIEDPDLATALVTVFNDANANFSGALQNAIDALPGIETLRFTPRVFNSEIGDEIASHLDERKLVPTLSFIDPWGYKGLSQRLINSVLKDWGSDCIFFFNYNRINMGLPNPAVDPHIDSLFGPERAQELRTQLPTIAPQEREAAILEKLAEALSGVAETERPPAAGIKSAVRRYVLPFCFLNDAGSRTSHYLVFVSKHVRGYEIMKDVMAKQSSKRDQGVPSFSYCPADRKYPLLFELTRPLDDLEEMLLRRFAGQRLTVENLFDGHHVGRPFIKKNYKDVLLMMEGSGRIVADPPAEQRKRGTIADRVIVQFPPADA